MKTLIGLVTCIFLPFASAYGQGPGNMRPPTGEEFIRFLDRNGDNKVSRSEFRGPGNHFSQFDRNNDGYITLDEAPTGPPGMRQSGSHPQGMQQQGPQMGQRSGGQKQLMDVHGAGAQRSDPKSGSTSRYSTGHGPQGDVVRIYNHARCVRGGLQNTNSKSLGYRIVDTAQTACYDNGSRGKLSRCPATGKAYGGQDGMYDTGQPDYTDNGNGTITDNLTGLMWQKSFTRSEWAEAPDLAGKQTTGGYNDWRVPTIKELYSLMQFNGATGTANPSSQSKPGDAVPYLNSKIFKFEYPTSSRYIDAQYITSTAYVSTVMNGQRAFFGVNFADGRIKGYPQAGNPKRQEYYVRFVRGNPDYGNNNFVDNGNATISDLATGLTWTKNDSGHKTFRRSISGFTRQSGGLNWQEALSFCENLTFAGTSDWRLPNAKELHSILDYTRSPDTTGSAAINPLFATSEIKDEGNGRDFPFFWSSTTHLDGRNPGEWAVYISFGEAEGFMGSGKDDNKQRGPKPKRRRK